MLRRQLYEKRPLVENKLMSGRQFLASEPQAEDTSDSDSKSDSKVQCICTHWTRPDAINTSIKLTQSPVITAPGRHNDNLLLCSVSRESEDRDQLAKSIRREVTKLSDKWSGLLTAIEIWQRKLDDALPVSGGNDVILFFI